MHRETRTGHLAGGGEEKKLLNSEGCREKQLCSPYELETGWRKVMGAVCLLGSLLWWQKENASFVCPPTLSFPGGCRCCGGHQAPEWGILEMSRGRTKERCGHKDISAEAAEIPPLSFLTRPRLHARLSEQLHSSPLATERSPSPPQKPLFTENDF